MPNFEGNYLVKREMGDDYALCVMRKVYFTITCCTYLARIERDYLTDIARVRTAVSESHIDS